MGVSADDDGNKDATMALARSLHRCRHGIIRQAVRAKGGVKALGRGGMGRAGRACMHVHAHALARHVLGEGRHSAWARQQQERATA